MKARDKAKEYIERLGKEGAWRQAAEEAGNSGSNEERDYFYEVMDRIKRVKE